MDFPYGETVTRLRGTPAESPYSDDDTDADWSDPDELAIPGWGVDDSRSEEPLADGRDSVVTDYVLYGPAGADVLAGDRVLVRGVTCEVVGHPAAWRNPFTGWAPGVVVKANRVDG